MDDKGRLWMDGKLIGEKTFEETGVLRETRPRDESHDKNRHERRKLEAMLRKAIAE